MASRQSVSPSGGHPAPACDCWQSTRRNIAFSAALTLCIALSGQPLPAQARQDFLAANIDATVSPREDFFQYASGGWLKRNPIPPDQGRWGTWNVVSEDLYSRLRRASEAAAATNAPRGSVEQLIGDFWFTGVDSATINQQGLGPLRPDLERIDAIRSIGDVIEVVAILHRRNMLLDGYLATSDPARSSPVVSNRMRGTAAGGSSAYPKAAFLWARGSTPRPTRKGSVQRCISRDETRFASICSRRSCGFTATAAARGPAQMRCSISRPE